MAKRSRHLEVWLHGIHVATLSEPSTYRYKLEFTDLALDTFGDGARVLSLALPISEDGIQDHRTDATRRPVSAFLEGLLPEGNLRTQVAASLGVLTVDKIALLEQVGSECAGAVQFLEEGSVPGLGHVRPLSDAEVDRLVADLPTYHFPEGSPPQASLAGIQDKVLLTRLDDRRWGWPEDGAVSSHLIKPEPFGSRALDHLVEAEDWAMRVANEAGLDAAETRLETFSGRRAVVVTRYDRRRDGSRIHQEDFCQALGLDPQAKYEGLSEGTPHKTRLSQLVDVAAPRSAEPDAFRHQLLSLITYNVVIGNGDAHSKNYSILLGTRGEVSLAPLYDSAPVMYLAPQFKNTGHVINGRTNIDWVSADDLTDEAARWGMARTRAQATVVGVLERTWEAVHALALPPGTESVLDRLEELWARRSWRPPT